MSQRERQPSGGAVEAAPRPAAGQPVPPRPPPTLKPGAKGAPLWEDLFRAAPPAQQLELLSLAGRQGVLELAGSRAALCPVRCLSREEQPDGLPHAIRCLTFEARARSLKEGSLEQARQGVASAKRRCVRRRQDEPAWAGLHELAERGDQ